MIDWYQIVAFVIACIIAILINSASRWVLNRGKSKTTISVSDDLYIPADTYLFVVRTGEVLKVTEVDYEKKTITVEKVEV